MGKYLHCFFLYIFFRWAGLHQIDYTKKAHDVLGTLGLTSLSPRGNFATVGYTQLFKILTNDKKSSGIIYRLDVLLEFYWCLLGDQMI